MTGILLAPAPSRARLRSPWWGVASLSITVFTLVTSEFLPASMLSRISGGLHVSEGTAGQSVTVTAIAAAIAGPSLAVLLPRLDRRIVMFGLTALGVASNLLVAIAPSLWMLLIARVLLGIAVGGFWAMSLMIVAALVSPERLGRAMTVVNVGVSVATVAAVPLGAYLGEIWGWRGVFVLTAVAGVAALAVEVLWLPSVPPPGAPGGRALLATLRSRLVLLGLLAIALIAGGHFAGFTYIRPAAALVHGLTPSALALLLVVYGATGFVGNLVSGPLADRRLRVLVLVVPVLLGAAMVLWATLGSSIPSAFAAAALWGLGFGALPTTIQTWMARVEPERLEAIGGLAVAMFQVAIALGAVVGGVLVDTIDVQATLLTGGIAAAAGGTLMFALRKFPPVR